MLTLLLDLTKYHSCIVKLVQPSLSAHIDYLMILELAVIGYSARDLQEFFQESYRFVTSKEGKGLKQGTVSLAGVTEA